MKSCVQVFTLVCAALVLAAPAAAQESAAARSTRKKLQQKISVEFKEIGVKAILDDVKREMEPPVSFKIDNTTGVSNNSKLSYKADNKTVAQILDGLSEKGEFGWFVKSDPKDRNDGFVIIRKYKDKERGFETGKEPKKGQSLNLPMHDSVPAALLEATPAALLPFIGVTGSLSARANGR